MPHRPRKRNYPYDPKKLTGPKPVSFLLFLRIPGLQKFVLHGRAVFVTAIPVAGEVPGGIVPVGIGLHLLQMPDQVPVVLALEVEYIASITL